MHAILALWAVPRSRSTAFKQMMRERGGASMGKAGPSKTHFGSEVGHALPEAVAQNPENRS
jgi:hypothetical protein